MTISCLQAAAQEKQGVRYSFVKCNAFRSEPWQWIAEVGDDGGSRTSRVRCVLACCIPRACYPASAWTHLLMPELVPQAWHCLHLTGSLSQLCKPTSCSKSLQELATGREIGSTSNLLSDLESTLCKLFELASLGSLGIALKDLRS